MQIALPFTEALALAATAGPLPPMVDSASWNLLDQKQRREEH